MTLSRKTLTIALYLFCTAVMPVFGQHAIEVYVQSADTREALPGASVQIAGTNVGAVADSAGYIIISDSALGPGSIELMARFVGYEATRVKVTIPATAPVIINMHAVESELEEVLITTTRSSRSIQSIPTRVEFIGAEELEEKITMQPGNIRMVLTESTGIQTQQTSVASANATIRIQGLDGRYTQLLRDGFPLYGGFSGGLSILQIPPLDLQQVDVIKGSASTLYGGGAIAGLVNLITKKPEEEREVTLFANATSAMGLDLSTYYREKYNKTGLTLLASRHSNAAYDPSDEGFSAIPMYTRYVVNPVLYVYPNDRVTITAGLNAAVEDRTGGDMKYLKGEGSLINSFFEKNSTSRYSTQLGVTAAFGERKLSVKNSFSFFDRTISRRNYRFSGAQSSFTEVSLSFGNAGSEWIAGGNLWTDNFSEDSQGNAPSRDFSGSTAGLFIQNVTDLSEMISLESGMRTDFTSFKGTDNGRLTSTNLLPRISMLFKWSGKFTSRAGAGLGYKTPTIFTERAEEQVFYNVLPVNYADIQMEKSVGVNADVNYHTSLGDEAALSVNQLFFYTAIRDPLRLTSPMSDEGPYAFVNSREKVRSYGAETNLKLEYGNYKLFLGYTFVNASYDGQVNTELPLTARNRINSVLMYEIEHSLRLGFEAFYFSRQRLTNGFQTPDYWIVGFSAQKKWEHLSLFINFENFTDTRQTRFGRINMGDVTNPRFSEVYAPLDGFVFNGGIIYTF